MTVVDLQRSASLNLMETYFALGAASGHARITHEDGYRLCLSSVDHPICNFAADLDLHPNAAARLAQLAADRTTFHVYRVPGETRHCADLLRRAGFQLGHRLTQMVWRPDFDLGPFPTLSLRAADSHRLRQAISAFMTEQFFSCQSGSFRRRVAEATSLATSLELYGIVERGKLVGAVMLCEQAETMGIYNLCVAAAQRNRGWGQEIVHAVQRRALQMGKPLVLQCEAALEEWYAKQGFEPSGFVDVFGLEQVP